MVLVNKEQKEVQQAFLDSEKQTMYELKQAYKQALADCNEKIRLLSARADMNPPELQSIIYQKNYQQAIKGQLEGIMANLQSNEYATISDYLTRCYQEGYIGTMYDLAGQGIPLIIPIDQEKVSKAIQIDSKLKEDLYKELGEDVNKLKASVRAEISRGIANGSSWNDVAANLALNFKNTPFNTAYNRSATIARTEGHRIQIQSALDAQKEAKKKGADVVKQWDSTLDGKTRDSHRKLDGQIRELDEDFEVDGMKAEAPGMFGDPAEDCNCRCALLQRARWALDESELDTLKERAEYFGLDKSNDFDDFKEKYLGISKEDIEGADSGSVRSGSQKMKVEEALANNGKNSKIEVGKREKRGQLDTGYSGKIPDDKLEEYNKKAFEQIMADTGYSEEKAKELHNALLDYFGGDYESILSGETETAKIIREGISNMPIYDGSIYRGMLFDDEDIKMFTNLKAGDSVPHKGIIESWSSNNRVAQSFCNDYYRNSVILECEENKTGAGVQHISKFGDREAEVLTSTKYEVVEVVTESKYDYLSRHKELLYFPDDLDYVEDDVKGVVVCRIKVREKK